MIRISGPTVPENHINLHRDKQQMFYFMEADPHCLEVMFSFYFLTLLQPQQFAISVSSLGALQKIGILGPKAE
jgi:hypothetical protein